MSTVRNCKYYKYMTGATKTEPLVLSSYCSVPTDLVTTRTTTQTEHLAGIVTFGSETRSIVSTSSFVRGPCRRRRHPHQPRAAFRTTVDPPPSAVLLVRPRLIVRPAPTPSLQRGDDMLKMENPVQWLVATRTRRRVLIRVAALVVVVPLFLQCVLAYLLGGDARLLPPALQHAKNVLIVTAHPDDECLFFSPTILGVLDRNHRIRGGLLVMSTGASPVLAPPLAVRRRPSLTMDAGNNDGIGETRKKELLGSCAALGIDSSRCVALDHPELQDNPKLWWNTTLIESIVGEHVAKWDINAIITFDEGGVSGHINHRAVSAAVSEYVANDASAPPAFKLVTTAVLRKYSGLLDLPLTAFSFTWRLFAAVFFPSDEADAQYSTKALIASTWNRYLLTRRAFASHDSQYSWDRHLYMILSRYVWFNDLTRIPGKA
ncbi:glycan biosynthesis protein [Drechmeria coniospora]|uniref:N-acetylglucosaminylphosphatidylinositol deacetylase n=1 Tax=Drechmeria coniospora TaxID=98403 RepID=A0A151GYF2_DRECN|nr:glycan biosynthesis protein [Drechmeria coniospora]KYK62126.1 glycan biosynthesis protein [Drechmeria coniospora]